MQWALVEHQMVFELLNVYLMVRSFVPFQRVLVTGSGGISLAPGMLRTSES